MKIIEKLAARSKDAFINPPVLIAFLGDSVTHACFDAGINHYSSTDIPCVPSMGYAARLIDRINEYWPLANPSLLNAGVGGDNAPGGLSRLERDVLNHNPDLVIVNFGLNDSMGGMEKLPDYENAMDEIFTRILSSGAECMLVTPNRMCSYVRPVFSDPILPEIAEKAVKIQNDGVLDAYVNAARALAKKHGIPVADANAIWNRLEEYGVDTTAMLVNGINHPSFAAHGIFTEEIFRTMLEV